jgi:hypothetical protein
MSIFYCHGCQRDEDGDDVGYVVDDATGRAYCHEGAPRGPDDEEITEDTMDEQALAANVEASRAVRALRESVPTDAEGDE